MAGTDLTTAMANRSIRTIAAELEFLADASLLTQSQLSSILSQLPSQNQLRAPIASQTPQPAPNTLNLPIRNNAVPQDPEKQQNGYYSPAPTPVPAYVPPPNQSQLPPLTHAVALYAYTPTDTGDLGLAPNDRIAVTEYMNAEWWKGRSERTGLEGIFPRSYVREDNQQQAAPGDRPMSYGNMPLAVAQDNGQTMAQGSQVRPHSKAEDYGKKFGKKLGNAAIFGAGADLGGKLVNSIF